MEQYKKQVKDNIQILIEKDMIDEAKSMIEEYNNIVKDDIDIYSIKSVIAIMEGSFLEAEQILKQGLKIDHNNFDLLYNTAYLYHIWEKLRLAIKYYEKSLSYVKSEIQEFEIKENIAELKKLYKESKEIRFSIVIPTRQRHETLKYAIETCLNQSYENYEIIVCDNNSSEETRQVVKSFNSNKITYIRSEENLCMSDNWDLAISHARGEYIILIGDDDGLLLHALKELDKLIEKTEAKVIRWETVIYNWPDSKFKNHANLISIPLSQSSFILNSNDVISKVIDRQYPYNVLPMLYNSAIHKDLINRMYEINGRIFESLSPDIYSGFWIALLNKEYISLNVSMTIGGISGSSNGIANIHNVSNNIIAEEFTILNEKSNIKCNSMVPDIPTISAAVLSSFYDAIDHASCGENPIKMDDKKVIEWYMNEIILRVLKIKDKTERSREWSKYLKLIKEKTSLNNNLLNWFYNNYPQSCPQEWFTANEHLAIESYKPQGYSNGTLNLNANEFEVTNVYEATQLCEKILNYNKTGIVWSDLTEN